jgi:hypothetical protein
MSVTPSHSGTPTVAKNVAEIEGGGLDAFYADAKRLVRDSVFRDDLMEARKHISLRSGCCHAFERRSAGMSTSHLTRLSKVRN